jgi:serine/threonine protein phosphatase PrpC
VLNSSGCKRLSFDHKCNDNTEVKRIKKAGGTISQERVFGKLALTRAFGDYSMKNYGVIATPTVNKITLNDGDKFIVICSDGVWDVMDEEDLFYYAAQYDDAKEFAETIIEESMKNGSKDNISCIVIKL